MPLDLALIQQQLFRNAAVRTRIARDYGLANLPDAPEEFASSVIAQFDQAPLTAPLRQHVANAEVFRAAVKALGSNSRNWAVFLKNESRLVSLLSGYDPMRTHQAFAQGTLSLDAVKSCLPGQSSTGDATAIRRWASLLTEVPNYYGLIQDVGATFQVLSQRQYHEPLAPSHLLLCLVGYFGNPSRRWPGEPLLPDRSRKLPLNRRKLPGMGYILASEFFRNLHWNGFKPDRHIQRLLDRWTPTAAVGVQPDVQRLLALIGRRGADLQRYLTYALVGISISPPGVTFSFSDNLVWLLGAYVEKKGRESDLPYVIDDRAAAAPLSAQPSLAGDRGRGILSK